MPYDLVVTGQVMRAPYERSLQVANRLRVFFVNRCSIRDRMMSFTESSRPSRGTLTIQRLEILMRPELSCRNGPMCCMKIAAVYISWPESRCG